MASPTEPVTEGQIAANPFGDPTLPPLSADATNDQKDAYWFKHIYKGDQMPQLTLRAVLVGGVLGMLMSAANLYTSLQIGWGFGIAITACVISFVMWNFVIFISRGKVSQMTVLENACMASTASAAGYATGSTIATMFGALMLLQDPPKDVVGEAALKAWAENLHTWDVTPPWVTGLFTLCTGLMGVFLAIPMKRQMINHEQLPFPSGIAAAETLKSLYSRSAESVKKAYILVIGLGAGLVIGFLRAPDDILKAVPWLNKFFGFFSTHDASGNVTGNWIRIPGEIEIPFIGRFYEKNNHPAGFAFEPSALLIAAGMIVGLRTSISLVVSSLVLYLGFAPYLNHLDAANVGTAGYIASFKYGGPDPAGIIAFNPIRWALWGGTAIMVFASLTSVAMQWKTIGKTFSGKREGSASDLEKMKEIEVPGKWMILGMAPLAIAMIWLQWAAFGVQWWAGLIAVAMSFVLSMVGSRATGETDTTPVGAMGKVMQLIFAVIVPNNINANLASAGVAANSAIGSADLLTDLKTGYLLGANPRRQFLAQFFGTFFGTLAIVPIWYLMVPTRAKLETFGLPSTRIWEAVARLLTKGFSELPESAKYAIVIGALIGIIFTVLERIAPPAVRKYMPSVTGLGLAWVMPFQNCFSFFVGAVIAFIWTKWSRRTATSYNIPVASGLIAGESLVQAFLAITATLVGLWPKISAWLGW